MSLDSRGVRRGRCTACNCDSYDGGSDMKKCLQCAHPPGKHENLDRGTSFPAASYHSQAASSQHDFGLHHMPPQHVHVPMELPRCAADGCQNQVWYDPGLGQALFSYCSPECRDRHLLPIQKQKLKEELEELKMELQQEVVKEISMTKPSSPKAKACDNSVHSKPPVSKQTQQEHSPQPPTPSTVETGSSASPTSTKGDHEEKVKPKQKTVVLVIEKHADGPCGLVLSKKPFMTDQKNIHYGLVVVGVVRDSKVYKMVQDGLIRMFDVIETVSDKSCADLIVPETDIQENFEKFVIKKNSVKLYLNRSIALPPVSSPLSYARKKYLVYSHILVLKYSEGSSDDYGLTLSDVPGQSKDYVQVAGISKGSPADLCRLKFGDKICMYALASPEGIQSSQLIRSKTLVQMKMDMEKAHRAKKNVILVVQQ